ncbi:MAG: VC0807 family protein [Pseudobdellovibrionaceae bacterium]
MKSVDQDHLTPPPPQKPENGFLNIIFNILIPVLILNKGSIYIGPLPALVLALCFPLGYGIYDYAKKKKTNFISILGLLNVLVTGGFALLNLEGIWFAIKEAAFPALIGIFVFASSYFTRPFIETLFLNPALVNVEKVRAALEAKGQEAHFKHHLKNSTQILAGSFFFSAVLNFVLAKRIFVPIDAALAEAERQTVLNQQIADMTYLGMLVITVPSFILLAGTLWYLLHGIRKYTGLTTEEVLVH